jgi:hypothetical protein
MRVPASDEKGDSKGSDTSANRNKWGAYEREC